MNTTQVLSRNDEMNAADAGREAMSDYLDRITENARSTGEYSSYWFSETAFQLHRNIDIGRLVIPLSARQKACAESRYFHDFDKGMSQAVNAWRDRQMVVCATAQVVKR